MKRLNHTHSAIKCHFQFLSFLNAKRTFLFISNLFRRINGQTLEVNQRSFAGSLVQLTLLTISRMTSTFLALRVSQITTVSNASPEFRLGSNLSNESHKKMFTVGLDLGHNPKNGFSLIEFKNVASTLWLYSFFVIKSLFDCQKAFRTVSACFNSIESCE